MYIYFWLLENFLGKHLKGQQKPLKPHEVLTVECSRLEILCLHPVSKTLQKQFFVEKSHVCYYLQVGKALEVPDNRASGKISELLNLTAACLSQIRTCDSHVGGSLAVWIQALDCYGLSGLFSTFWDQLKDQGFSFYCFGNELG